MTVNTIQQAADGGALALPQAIGGDLPGLAVLQQWVAAAAQAEQLVSRIVDTAFVPASLWPLPPGRTLKDFPGQNPRVPDRQEDLEAFRWRRQVAIAAGTSAVLRGAGLGLDPLVSLDQIFVIYGRPSMYVKLKVALVTARGHVVDTVERTDERAVVRGRRAGDTDFQPPVVITIEAARRAGWVKNDAYEKTPADMLWNRAASRVVDMIGADVLFGIASIEDVEPVDEDAAATPARVTIDDVRGTSAAPAAASILEPAPEQASAAAPPAEQQPPRIDERTWRAINTAFVSLGVTGPGQNEKRLTAISNIVGHPVEKGRDLTAVQGDVVLSTLQGVDRTRLAELVGVPAPQPVDDVDLGDADPDGDVDDVPEPDDAERELGEQAEAIAQEPEGWR